MMVINLTKSISIYIDENIVKLWQIEIKIWQFKILSVSHFRERPCVLDDPVILKSLCRDYNMFGLHLFKQKFGKSSS